MRKPKTPLGAWIAGERRARGWKSEELAARLGLSPTTVRGWEAGRSVSQENLAALERLFGLQAPGTEAPTDLAALVAAIDRQTEATTALVERLDLIFEPLGRAVAQLVRAQVEANGGPEPSPASAPARPRSAKSPQGVG